MVATADNPLTRHQLLNLALPRHQLLNLALGKAPATQSSTWQAPASQPSTQASSPCRGNVDIFGLSVGCDGGGYRHIFGPESGV